MKVWGTYLVWAGSVLLTITALFHFSGYFEIPREPSPVSFFDSSLKPLWLFASLHWILTAMIALLMLRAHKKIAIVVLNVSAIVLLVDAILLYVFIGPFIGEWLLAITAVFFVIAPFGIQGRVGTTKN